MILTEVLDIANQNDPYIENWKKSSSWLWLPKIKFWWDKLIKRPTLNEFSCILISESKSRYVWKSREALYSLRHREDGRNDRLERNGVFFTKEIN